MNKPDSQSELTSTLHIGVRSVVGSAADSALSSYLSAISEKERAAVDLIINGGEDRAMIVIHRGPAKGARFLLDQDEITIGRSSDAAIFLDDITVSRSHARIERTNKGFTITDLGSLNGTYLNNESLSSALLGSGDEIQIGKFHALFIGAINKNL